MEAGVQTPYGQVLHCPKCGVRRWRLSDRLITGVGDGKHDHMSPTLAYTSGSVQDY